MTRFAAPPNWPPPPDGWVPPGDWRPDPAWGPSPEGWVFWLSNPSTRDAPSPSRYQNRWLKLYWTATALSLLFLILAVTGTDVPASGYIGTSLGALAAGLGLVMARKLAKSGVSDVTFDKATAGMRVISVGWVLFIVVIVALVVVQTDLGATTDIDSKAGVDGSSSLRVVR